MSGDRDEICGHADQQELLKRIPGSMLHVFENVGHTQHWEVPIDFVRCLAQVLLQ
jgi:pimeloyl-ACP methyl ester carboxylesterase